MSNLTEFNTSDKNRVKNYINNVKFCKSKGYELSPSKKEIIAIGNIVKYFEEDIEEI